MGGSSVLARSRGVACAGVRDQRQQVGDADVHACLRQQRCCLAAVVGLVVEEVQQHRDEFARETVAARVGVTQHVPQVVVVQGRDPALDDRVQPAAVRGERVELGERSEEHTSELQSLMRSSYAVFCLKNKTTNTKHELQLKTSPRAWQCY